MFLSDENQKIGAKNLATNLTYELETASLGLDWTFVYGDIRIA